MPELPNGATSDDMTLSDPNPQFQGEYLANMMSHGILSDS